jgi:hypothetical protein
MIQDLTPCLLLVPYALIILRRAQKELAELPAVAYTRIRDAIRKLDQAALS